jgi:hypothetical protein
MLIGFLTYDGDFHETHQDDLAINALKNKGFQAMRVIWNDPKKEWKKCNVIVVSSVWDYHLKVSQFLEVLKEIDSENIILFNSYETIEWNSDKHYLLDIKEKGFSIIDTQFLKKENLRETLFSLKEEEYVLKPTVSASATHTLRFKNEIDEISKTIEYCEKNANDVNEWMLQPFASEVVKDAEYSYIFLNSKFSHCVQKKPKVGSFLTSPLHTDYIKGIESTSVLLKQAQEIIDVFAKDCFHVRLDVIHRNGNLCIMELELIEPYLFPNECLKGNFDEVYVTSLLQRTKNEKRIAFRGVS